MPHLGVSHDPAARRVLVTSQSASSKEHRSGNPGGHSKSRSVPCCVLNPARLGNTNRLSFTCSRNKRRTCQVRVLSQSAKQGLPNNLESGGVVGIRNEGVSWRWAALGLTWGVVARGYS
ncbi:hypothetical protein CSPAE12_05511 [Colletotrichum incanum]|nr:hypothetical protein CSPAE12_05511 [Colletotrichum incanum]